jgi:hypothetical protein
VWLDLSGVSVLRIPMATDPVSGTAQ